jgi:hypothetical protein
MICTTFVSPVAPDEARGWNAAQPAVAADVVLAYARNHAAERPCRWTDGGMTIHRTIFRIASVLALGVSAACNQGDSDRERDGATDAIQIEPEPPPSDVDRACAVLDPTSCGGHQECGSIAGQPLDAARRCWKAQESAGCREGGRLCGTLVTVAKDPAGHCWLFSSTCIPVDWTRLIRSQNASCDVLDTATCR